MRIALPIWEERVSPVFDVAEQVVLVDVEDRQIYKQIPRALTATDPTHRAETLAGWGVQLLICGAISQVLEQLLIARRVRVRSRVRGQVDEVLAAHLAGRLDDTVYLMPGCPPPVPTADAPCGEPWVIEAEDRNGSEIGDESSESRRRWVARDGSTTVGLLELHEQGQVGYIVRLDTDPSCQHGSVSCHLLQQALAYCRRRGLLKVVLDASAQSRRVQRLVRCFGFQPRGRCGRQSTLEFYLNLYRVIDEKHCAAEVDRATHNKAEM